MNQPHPHSSRAIRHDADSPIFLIGFMGSGKSTIGQALADLMERPFVDLDTRIEAAANASIPDIINLEGEERFRQIETNALREAALIRNAIVASGGGIVLKEENRVVMRDAGPTVWLDVPFDVCWRRILEEGETRPLAPDEATARNRYEQRQPLYQQAMIHLAITPGQTPEEIAEEILQQLDAIV